jgi:hypothetical protein
MTLPQQDAVDAMRRAQQYDPAREPFADPGIDPRVMGRALAGVDTTTGEIHDTSRRAWPPRSKGPLPPPDHLPPDLNIFTAQDEIDAWAHEHDAVTTALASAREVRDAAEIDYLRERAKARRRARANPTERGRRTSEDITSEVDEALIGGGWMQARLDADTQIEILTGRLFRAKDNIARLDSYIRSLPRVSDRP